VAEVFVSESNHTVEGKQLIHGLGLETYALPVMYTGPLLDSATLHRMFEQRAFACLGETEKSKVAVLLVRNGQPDEWDRLFTKQTEHEVQFRRFIVDSIHRQYDIPELVHKSCVPKGYPLLNLGAWDNDQLDIQAIKEKIDAVILKKMSI
jgi:hypothetical protein